MKCDKIDMGHGSFAFVCTRGRRHNCEFCSRYATKQCDFPVIRKGAEHTCDAWMCDRCAVSRGPNIDWCPPHERNAVKIMEARLVGGPLASQLVLEMPEREDYDQERTVERP